MLRNIALSGKAAAGKDTIADELLPLGYEKASLADSLKRFCSEKYMYPLNWNYTQEGKNKYIKVTEKDGRVFYHGKVRDLLIEVGKQGRLEDKDYWIKKLEEQLPDKPVIITDVRFKNEADYYKNKGYLLVRIDAPRIDRYMRSNNYELATSEDESETELDEYEGFDLRINNKNREDIQEAARIIREAATNI